MLNALKVEPGSSFAAFGATTIFATDVVPSRLKLALELGATHIVDSSKDDPVEAIRKVTGKGVDFAMDSTGIPAVIRNAVLALRPTGSAAVVGASKPGALLDLDANDLMQSVKSIRGVAKCIRQ